MLPEDSYTICGALARGFVTVGEIRTSGFLTHLSEGQVRGRLVKLKGFGLVASSRQGYRLTEHGRLAYDNSREWRYAVCEVVAHSF